MNKPLMFRQGDVFLIQVASDAKLATIPKPADARGVVIAEGETSGHHHQVFGDGAMLFDIDDSSGRMLLDVSHFGASLRVVGSETIRALDGAIVPRHEPIDLPPGRYIVGVQRTWNSSMRSVRVED